MQGTIKTVKLDAGYGFIRPDGASSGKDLFFHVRALEGLEFDESLTERRVEYDIEESDRGPRAKNVRAA